MSERDCEFDGVVVVQSEETVRRDRRDFREAGSTRCAELEHRAGSAAGCSDWSARAALYGWGVVIAPEFDRPPVVEMALGIQFQPLFGLRGISLSPLREVWRERYPLVEEVPPLPPGVERVGGQPLGVQLAFGPGPALRYWFMSDDGADLVQLQNRPPDYQLEIRR